VPKVGGLYSTNYSRLGLISKGHFEPMVQNEPTKLSHWHQVAPRERINVRRVNIRYCNYDPMH
tara:strand:- start:64182 stop:64370 length:189 start_codon:yes stop_codon:yes gene_type:complete